MMAATPEPLVGLLVEDPRVLAATLPDTPRWIYARSVLLSGSAVVRVNAGGDAALAMDSSTAVLVGRPDRELLRDVLADDLPGRSLLVHDDASTLACSALRGWAARPFTVHALPGPVGADAAPPAGVVVCAPLDPTLLAGLPADIQDDAAGAPAAAIRFVDGAPVAICTVSDQAETLWDVGIDTVQPARRRGHATAVFRALAAAMAAQGRQPVWASYNDYPPSLALATRLGFHPVAYLAELTPPTAR